MAYFLEWCPSEILLRFSVFALSSSNLWNSYWAFQSILRSFGKWWNCLKRGNLEIFLKPFSTFTKDFISTLDKTLLPLAAFGSFHFYPSSQFLIQPSGIVTEKKNKTKQNKNKLLFIIILASKLVHFYPYGRGHNFFSNTLMIYEVKVKEVTTAKVVWISDTSYH